MSTAMFNRVNRPSTPTHCNATHRGKHFRREVRGCGVIFSWWAMSALSSRYKVTNGQPGRPNHAAISSVQLSLVRADVTFKGVFSSTSAARFRLNYKKYKISQLWHKASMRIADEKLCGAAGLNSVEIRNCHPFHILGHNDII